ncbi:MAG: type II toxin-antitoxin system VapC family toxin [Candidatus Sulfotelmatobacter sp.]
MILLDTHVVIWLAQDYRRISTAAHAAIEDERNENRGLAVSDITLVEIAQLASHGRINLIPDVETVLSEVEHRFVILPITSGIAMQAFALPANYPKDRIDRVIGATAVIEGLKLVTADRAIRQSKAVPTIW